MRLSFNQITIVSLFLFIFLALYNTVDYMIKANDDIKKSELIKAKIQRISKNSNLVLELQRERGLTNIYFANPISLHRHKMLKQRAVTQNVLLTDTKKMITKLRLQVDSNTVNRIYAFNNYSQMIRDLLLDTKSLTYNSDDKLLKNELQIYNDLNALQERLGILRATIGLVLSSNSLSKENEADIRRNNILFQHELESTFINDLLSSRKYTRQISKTKCLKRSFLIARTLKSELQKEKGRLSALEWFKISTCAIDKINSYVNKQLEIINKRIDLHVSDVKNSRYRYLGLASVGFAVLLLFVYLAFKRSQELLKEHVLLKNYKKAIDYSSMVLSTDKDRVITHVNEQLAETALYAEDELLGKDLSMINHLDMSIEVQNDILKAIEEKKNWNGFTKNRKKDGSFFWSDTYMIPILDDKNNLVEYISIMCDISDIINLNEEINETQKEIIYRLGEAVESRSKETGNHIKRVSKYSKLLAELHNLPDEECETIFAAASMHDIGKIAIPDAILLKPAKLTQEEWIVMKTHSEIGYNLFKDSKRELLKAAADISYEHHEYYNGKGYPQGLKGEEISIFGRIVAIADVFDALLSKRVYKEAWSTQEVISLFKAEAGEQFDPNLTKLLVDNFDDFVAIWRENQ